MAEKEPVAQTSEESEERIESGEKSNIQKGSVPSDTSENKEAPKQEKAAASPK